MAPAPPPDTHQPQLQSPAQGQPAPRRQFIAEPEMEEQVEEQAAAAHVLLCCDDSLRLYPAEGIRVGDRSAHSVDNLLQPLSPPSACSLQPSNLVCLYVQACANTLSTYNPAA